MIAVEPVDAQGDQVSIDFSAINAGIYYDEDEASIVIDKDLPNGMYTAEMILTDDNSAGQKQTTYDFRITVIHESDLVAGDIVPAGELGAENAGGSNSTSIDGTETGEQGLSGGSTDDGDGPEGYYDEEGNQIGGFFDEDGNWIGGYDEDLDNWAGGLYDEEGNPIDSVYDSEGNWIDLGEKAKDIQDEERDENW